MKQMNHNLIAALKQLNGQEFADKGIIESKSKRNRDLLKHNTSRALAPVLQTSVSGGGGGMAPPMEYKPSQQAS